MTVQSRTGRKSLAELDKARNDRAEQDKTRNYRAEQDKTRYHFQRRTRQEMTVRTEQGRK